MIRPEIRDWLKRWSETLVAGGVLVFGLWLATWGGWFFAAIGLLVALVGVSLSIGAWRRMPFRRQIDAPGVVEVEEGAIRYFGAAALGGEIALRDLTEIRLLRLQGRGHWRLRNQQGEALLIPIDAAGAASLADAFTSLPGLKMGAVSNALAHVAEQRDAVSVLWRRSDQGSLT